MHRLATTATIKDGKSFVNHMFGFGFGNGKHIILNIFYALLILCDMVMHKLY